MRRPAASPLTRMVAAAAVLASLFVVGGVPSGSSAGALDLTEVMPVLGITEGPDAEHPIIGYTLASSDSQATCELLRIDWATGLTTDLPSTPTAEACVTDLAVAPDGTVYGIAPVASPLPTALACASVGPVDLCGRPLARLVTFAADGTPTSMEIGPSLTYDFDAESLAGFRGVAVDNDGVVFVIVNGLWVDVTTCLPEPLTVTPPAAVGASTSIADGIIDWSACLFTVDPATGEMTLVGPSTLPGNVLAALSIGADGGRTLALLLTPDAVGPSSGPSFYWGAVNLGTGAVDPTGSVYENTNGLFDQLRSGSLIYALVEDAVTGGYRTALVDPATGAITPLTDLVTELPPRPEPARPTFTG